MSIEETEAHLEHIEDELNQQRTEELVSSAVDEIKEEVEEAKGAAEEATEAAEASADASLAAAEIAAVAAAEASSSGVTVDKLADLVSERVLARLEQERLASEPVLEPEAAIEPASAETMDEPPAHDSWLHRKVF